MLALASEPERLVEMGRPGWEHVERRYPRPALASTYLPILERTRANLTG
jgi:hypothetical protein